MILLTPMAGHSQEWDLEERPWEKFAANLGVFISAVDSNFRIGTGVGLDIDVEDLLGLDSTNSVFRTDAMWRFSKNRRHRLDFTWFAFRRDGQRQILEDITIGDGDDQTTINAGTRVEAFFDLDIYQLAYCLSFFQDGGGVQPMEACGDRVGRRLVSSQRRSRRGRLAGNRPEGQCRI